MGSEVFSISEKLSPLCEALRGGEHGNDLDSLQQLLTQGMTIEDEAKALTIFLRLVEAFESLENSPLLDSDILREVLRIRFFIDERGRVIGGRGSGQAPDMFELSVHNWSQYFEYDLPNLYRMLRSDARTFEALESRLALTVGMSGTMRYMAEQELGTPDDRARSYLNWWREEVLPTVNEILDGSEIPEGVRIDDPFKELRDITDL